MGQQLVMMLTLLITSKGIAAVPRASLVVLSGTLTAFGLPLEGVAVILGVDELMDMARTMVNLVGNCLATAVMARWEGELVMRAVRHRRPSAPAPSSRRRCDPTRSETRCPPRPHDASPFPEAICAPRRRSSLLPLARRPRPTAPSRRRRRRPRRSAPLANIRYEVTFDSRTAADAARSR